MKKLLLSMGAALMCMTSYAASSQLYLIGGPAGGWNPTKGTPLEQTESGVFKCELKLTGADYFAFADQLGSSDGDWNGLNSHRYGPAVSNTVPVEGENDMYYAKDASWMLPAGEYSLTINTNTNKLILGGEVVVEIGDLYFRGGMNNWEAQAAYKMNTTDKKIFTKTFDSFNGGVNFKIGSDDWFVSLSSENKSMTNGTYKLVQGGEGNDMALGVNMSNVTFTLDYDAMTLTVDGTQEGEIVIDYTSWYVNVIGPFNGWTDNGVNPNEEGISETTELPIGDQGFKVKVWYSGGPTEGIYYISDGNAIPTDQWVQLYEDTMDGAPVMIAGATETSVYTVKYNCATNQVYVTLTSGGGDVPTGDYLYIVGDGEGIGWDLPGMAVAKGDDGKFTFTIDGLTKFKASKAYTTDWDTFNGNAYSTGETTFDAEVYMEAEGQTLPIKIWGQDQLLPWAGTYTITIDLTAMTMTAKTETPMTVGDIYIMSELNDWQASPEWMMTKVSDSEYTYTCKDATILPQGTGIKFADAGFSTINYGFEGEVPMDGTPIDLVYNGANIVIPQEFVGVITLENLSVIAKTAQATFKYDPTLGVNEIIAADGEAVYFNLQGVKVNNPEKGGLYIKVVDGKAVKVIL